MLHLSTHGGSFHGLSTWCEVKMNLQYFERPSYIRRGDNVKIYKQMMDLEYSEKVFFFSKNLNSPRCKLLRTCNYHQ